MQEEKTRTLRDARSKKPMSYDKSNGAKLSREQRRFLALLGLPAFGISLAYTVVTTYLPYLINQLSGPAVTGLLIGAEGVFALTLPIIIGGYSDSLRTRIGGRMPSVLAAGALAVPALVVMGFSGGSLVAIGITLAVFFAAYFAYQAPYYALFPDLVPEEMHPNRSRKPLHSNPFRRVLTSFKPPYDTLESSAGMASGKTN